MENKLVFEYAVIRVVPRVEREEFINVGVILFCKQRNYLGIRIHLHEERLLTFLPQDKLPTVQAHLAAFEQIAEGLKTAGEIALLDPAERFRWLTATRSTMVQCSRVHPGMCQDPELYLEHLFLQMVS